jgi:23S rRNA (cytosine1962-C5)-methyltransferase
MENLLPKVTLAPGRDRSVRRFHPWIYSGAIAEKPNAVKAGDIVEVLSATGDFLGCAFYADSSIALKVFSFKKVVINPQYWCQRIAHAGSVRAIHGLTPDAQHTNTFRLVNGEGDLLPGLIIDVYGGLFVVQCHSLGMFQLLDDIVTGIREFYGDSCHSIYLKSEHTLDGIVTAQPKNRFLYGTCGTVTVREQNIHYQVDAERGQKTGFFIDQRLNRQILVPFALGKRVLNLFSYTGGFSMAAHCGGATHVTSVDVSAEAISMLMENMTLNQFEKSNAEAIQRDAFEYLEQCSDKFDVIIVDPPPFAKSRGAIEKALTGYRAINNLALKRLSPQGMLMTFSCSQVVTVPDFERVVSEAAADTGKQLAIVRRLGAPECHPVSLFHPEGSYLKGLLLRSLN